MDDRLYAWEAMSLLLAADELPEAAQAHVLRTLLHFLCAQITTNLEGDTSSFAVMASSPTVPVAGPLGARATGAHVEPTETMLLNHALEAVARLSKGFSQERMTKRRQQVGAETLAAALLPACTKCKLSITNDTPIKFSKRQSISPCRYIYT